MTQQLRNIVGCFQDGTVKEAVPKVARVAVLYDPANPATVLELKEVLRVAAHSLGLTVRS